MNNKGLIIAIVFAVVIILAWLILLAVYTIKRTKGNTKDYKEINESDDVEMPTGESQKLIQKRGVITDKKYRVLKGLKEGTFIPTADFVWAIQISSTDGTMDSCFVNEDTYNSLNIGDPVTYFKEGDRYYIDGIDVENIHQMTLDAEPFEKIRDGEKTIELRLNDEKRQKIKVGDKISFTLKGSETDYLMTKVVSIHKFSSFKDLYDALPLDKCGYSKSEVKCADPNDMRQYYSAEDEAKYGVVGIEIELDMRV